MEILTRAGRYFFAAGVLGIGIEHFIFQDFILGRAPAWPESLPGKTPWAYLTGALFVIISLAVFTGKKARPALVIGAALTFLWAFLRHIPVVAADQFLYGSWTSAGKALVFIGGSLAISASCQKTTLSGQMTLNKLVNLEREFILVGRVCLGVFLIVTGIQHFIFTDFVSSLIPEWFPGNAIFWTDFAGVTLIAGGIGLFIPYTASLAAFLSGVMIFSWVWIVHIPRVMVSVSDNIAVFEALAFSGIAFVVMRLPEKN